MPGRTGLTSWDSSWPPGTRIPANGLRPRSKRGAFATTWWGRRFTAAVEEAAGAGRLSRGRTYARAGQVVHLDVGTPGTRTAGRVLATVQGSRATPYDVVLTLATWDAETRAELADALAADPSALTAVLGGTLPESFEQLCLDAGLVLLPRSLSDLRTSCTCPDLVEPCKHAAAVVYLLAERLDDDPFTVLRLRGVDRDALLSLVAERRAARENDGDGGAAAPTRRARIGGPLPADDSFWRGRPLPPPPDPAPPAGTSALDALDASLLGPAGDAIVARLRPLLVAMTDRGSQNCST
ncbi:Uncharacterized conserved protein, contains Zn finger domain [Quadrisphaera granulorum]|uniref:Putative Zn finger protein n=1 Tax=Quadrisphaera granulorum TaxID=317664 RepID=A0A316A4X3_9ACTN|nr:SWIM zinc finger family protein [Quadrisphaera granulorum]PWJ52951.1 putative Zn finger protein [Quadrisphaera granulorum]SZE97333.1 Uncharacterized conserved protein, contains Zn finger domain [Quadrisphaera granulorum]